jgi:hypothetical protein
MPDDKDEKKPSPEDHGEQAEQERAEEERGEGLLTPKEKQRKGERKPKGKAEKPRPGDK